MEIKAGRKDNSGRRSSGGGPRPERRDQKRGEAEERTAAWRAMTPQEKLKDLDARLGVGLGAVKQRAKLNAAIVKLNAEKALEQSRTQPATRSKSTKTSK